MRAIIAILLILLVLELLTPNTTAKFKEDMIGRSLVVGKDTLQITKYSRWYDSYTLSNELELNADKIKSFEILSNNKTK